MKTNYEIKPLMTVYERRIYKILLKLGDEYKIIPQINEAARQHAEIIENLCYPENWKKCRHCGKTLLVNTDNFVRKSRSSDGFSNQCKRCDKEIRQQKK